MLNLLVFLVFFRIIWGIGLAKLIAGDGVEIYHYNLSGLCGLVVWNTNLSYSYILNQNDDLSVHVMNKIEENRPVTRLKVKEEMGSSRILRQ